MFNAKAVKEVEEKCNKALKVAVEKQNNACKLVVEKSFNQLKAELEAKFNLEKNDLNLKDKASESKEIQTKAKLSKSKIKELKEAGIIKGFEKDCGTFFDLKINCGLDAKSQKCKKCDFETHSEGLLRMHKVKDHNLKETFQNIVLGFEFDLERHIQVLTAMGEDINTKKCDECEYKTSSDGKLQMHRTNNHQKY